MRGHRKFIVVLAAMLCGFFLALLGKLTADFATIAGLCVGTYNVAHAVADYAHGKNGGAA